jgi:predicted O-linked N-acetylglucosamine transferase (SPINDLY family)
MSYRFAPLQCALWGHPVTTGSRHIDWFISADAMEPPEAERNYSERLLRLPRLGACYPYPALAPDLSVAIPARRDPGAVHFLLAQNVVKLTPIHDELLARIAQALPTAQFSLTPHPKEHVRAELAERMRKCFESHGLDFDQRVHIHPWLSEAQFLGLAAQSDVNLDSLGFSGGVTTLEITRFDVPTVTLPGQVMRARQSYGMLKLMGLDELIAQDPDDYVRIAVRLGREPGYRAAVRARIAACKHVLYDDQGVIEAFTRFIESEVARRAS